MNTWKYFYMLRIQIYIIVYFQIENKHGINLQKKIVTIINDRNEVSTSFNNISLKIYICMHACMCFC